MSCIWRILLLLFGAILLAIALSVPESVQSVLHDKAANRWRDEASIRLAPTATPLNFEAWLKSEGFQHFVSPASKDLHDGEAELSIHAYRLLSEGSLVTQTASVHLYVEFESDGSLRRIEADVWPFFPPGTRQKRPSQWPMTIAKLVPVVMIVWMFLLIARHSRWRKQGRCFECGYDLRGAESERCPECGSRKWIRAR